MNTATDKVTRLADAIDRYIHNGSHISIGGFTINRNPMAAVYEIIRQKKRDLHVYAHSNGQGIDELVGGGCVAKLEIAYAGSGRFAPTCIRFRKGVEAKTILVEDYSNYQMTLRFMAGAMGVPFLPTRSALGTDIIARWGFSEALRAADPKLPNKKLTVMDNPFEHWGGTEKVVLVPAIQPDVTLLHVQEADAAGTARIKGLTFADVEQAKAARHVVLTCEKLLDTEILRTAPENNQIPGIIVDAVVPVPYGAFPTACYHCYDYDPVYLNTYRHCALDDRGHQQYLDEWIFAVADHQALLEKVGKGRLANIKADPRTGYAVGLDRK